MTDTWQGFNSFLYCFVLWGEVRLSVLGTSATSGPIAPVPDGR
jgi:hypothetical protein